MRSHNPYRYNGVSIIIPIKKIIDANKNTNIENTDSSFFKYSVLPSSLTGISENYSNSLIAI